MIENQNSPSVARVIRTQRDKLGIDLDDLAELAGIEKVRLQTLEGAVEDEATFAELNQLSRFLGVDLESYDPEIDDEPEKRPEIVTLLKSNENYLPNQDWTTVINGAEIAREYVRLERWLEQPERFQELRKRFQPRGLSSEAPWKQGQLFAMDVRKKLGVDGPIDSIYEFCRQLGVLIVEAFLPASVSALCLADEAHGPTIIVNIQGANDSLLPRRFAIAHELCHILYDEYEMESLQRFDTAPGYFEAKNKPDIEKRADAFAIYLLCPEGKFRAEWFRAEQDGLRLEERVRRMMELFGVSFTATKYHLQSLDLLSHQQAESLSSITTDTPEKFIDSEERASPTAYNTVFTPLARLRRGEFLTGVLLAYREELISRSAVLDFLDIDGTTLDQNVEEWCRILLDGVD